MLEELSACERRVWQALVDGDVAADAAALDDGFWGVYPSGFAGKSDHVDQLAYGPTIVSFVLSEFRMMRLASTHAVLSYHARFTRVGAPEPEEMFVSSIWRRDDPGWVNVFSQDTPAG